jgi:methyl-accepting chemotaxis protein
MPFFRSLVLHLVAALTVPAVVGWYVSTRLFPLSAEQARMLGVSVPLAFGLLLVVVVAVLARLVAPLRAALGSTVAPSARRHAAAAAMRVPHRMALLIFGLAGGATAAILLTERRIGLPLDVALAGAAASLAFGLMTAMLAYAVAAIDLAPALEALGPADIREKGTVRGKVLIIGYGILVITALLVGSLSYARYRADLDQAHVAAAERVLEEAAVVAVGEGPARAAPLALRAAGTPVLLVSKQGAILARAGRHRALDFATPHGPAVEAVDGGWILRRAVGDATLVGFLPEAPLVAKRHAFWRAAAVLGALILGATSLLVWLAAKTLTIPLRSLGEAAGRIASGDLTVSPASITRDEMGQLAAEFRRMAQGLSALVNDVQAATRGVHEGAREMGDIGDRVRGGALEEHDRVVAVNAAVEAMQDSVSSIGRGIDGLTEYVATTSSVVGEMAAALEEVRRQAGDLIRSVDAAGTDVEQLSHAGRRAQTQLSSLNEVATNAGTSLGAVSVSLSTLQGAADESQTTAGHVAEMSDAAGGIVEEAVAGIEALRQAVDDAKRRVAALGRRSDDVEQILDFVGEVAGRTNLLSLNASIIATQAGEHGKAFAVVADQIRELAAQIASSTKSIGEIIGAVRDDVGGTARLIDRTEKLAAEGVALARKSLGALHEIRAATAHGREGAAAIQLAVQAHARSSGTVADLVNSVADNSRSVAEAIQMVGRSVSSVQSVNRNVGALADKVSRALDEQSGLGRRQLEGLERINARVADISRAVSVHESATRRVRELLAHLTRTAALHETAVSELAGVADRLGGRSRALADRVDRFKV